VTITGTNDAPTIVAATATGAVTEDTHPTTATCAITFQDLDLIDSHNIPTSPLAPSNVSISAPLPGFNPATDSFGTLTLSLSEDTTDTSNLGTVGWTFTADNALLQQLAQGQVVTQTYSVTITDPFSASTSQLVTVTITGTNDAPTIVAATATGAVTED